MLEMGIEAKGLKTAEKLEREKNKSSWVKGKQKVIMQVKIPVHALRCACITVRKENSGTC